MLAYYLHDLSPFVVKIPWLNLPIRWYGVSYLAGFFAAYFLLIFLARRGMLRIPVERVPDLVLNGCIWGVLLGGRMGHVLFYGPEALWDFSYSFPFWGVLKVWQGGMSAHGGVIGVILTLIIWCRKNKFSIINVGDAACMVVPLGLLFGRIANFINGELYGAKSAVAWAVRFPTELAAPTNGKLAKVVADKLPGLSDGDKLRHLTDQVQRYADQVIDPIRLARWEIHGPSDLVRLIQSPADVLPKGTPQDIVVTLQTFVREQFEIILPTRHPSQLYEAALEGLALFAICWLLGRYWKKDGMASGAFLTFYPVMRIICEQYRIGSEPYEWLLWTHLSQGVILSLVMFVPGFIYWVYRMRQPAKICVPGGLL